MFFTGCAGTGKSLLLRHILRALPPAATFVTGAKPPFRSLSFAVSPAQCLLLDRLGIHTEWLGSCPGLGLSHTLNHKP